MSKPFDPKSIWTQPGSEPEDPEAAGPTTEELEAEAKRKIAEEARQAELDRERRLAAAEAQAKTASDYTARLEALNRELAARKTEETKTETKPETNPYDVDEEPVKFAQWEITQQLKKEREAIRKEVLSELTPQANAIMGEIGRIKGDREKQILKDLEANPHYKVLKEEIDAEMARLEPEQRTAEARQMAFFYVRGQNFDKLQKADTPSAPAKSYNHTEVDESPTALPKTTRFKITPQIARVAAQYGMDAQKYARSMYMRDPQLVQIEE